MELFNPGDGFGLLLCVGTMEVTDLVSPNGIEEPNEDPLPQIEVVFGKAPNQAD